MIDRYKSVSHSDSAVQNVNALQSNDEAVSKIGHHLYNVHV